MKQNPLQNRYNVLGRRNELRLGQALEKHPWFHGSHWGCHSRPWKLSAIDLKAQPPSIRPPKPKIDLFRHSKTGKVKNMMCNSSMVVYHSMYCVTLWHAGWHGGPLRSEGCQTCSRLKVSWQEPEEVFNPRIAENANTVFFFAQRWQHLNCALKLIIGMYRCFADFRPDVNLWAPSKRLASWVS